MTNSELADLVCSGIRPLTVSMSKEGVRLRVGDAWHTITGNQAEIVFDAMHAMARPTPSSTEAG